MIQVSLACGDICPMNLHENLSFTDHWIRIREFDKKRFPQFQLNNQ